MKRDRIARVGRVALILACLSFGIAISAIPLHNLMMSAIGLLLAAISLSYSGLVLWTMRRSRRPV